MDGIGQARSELKLLPALESEPHAEKVYQRAYKGMATIIIVAKSTAQPILIYVSPR